MKTASFSNLIGAAALGALLMGGIKAANATPTSLSFSSDFQTYVVSSTAPSAQYGTPEDQTNFFAKKAMMISAPVVDPIPSDEAYATVPRAMDSLFSFNTSSYVSQFNTIYGAGNWTVTSVTVELSSNFTGQGTQPNNPDFNEIASGNFNFAVLGTNPDLTTITWNSLQAYLPTTTVTSVGTFYWDATQNLGNMGDFEYVQDIYSLDINATLIAAILSGEFTLLGTAADNQVGYLFCKPSRVPPAPLVMTITADETLPPAAPVAVSATSVTATGFTAGWDTATGAGGYDLDVSPNSGFGSFVTGFNNLNVGDVTSYPVTGLSPGTQYYYRLRAYNAYGTSGNSNTITVASGANLSVAMTGSGSVTSVPPGISCTNGSGACSATFGDDALVTLTASAGTGYAFGSWSGACSGAGSCQVTMTANENVTATFLQTFTDSSQVTGGDGTITPTSAVVDAGGAITFTITPASGYILSGLTDNGTAVTATPGPSGTYTYTITDVTGTDVVDATFSPAPATAVPALSLPAVLLLTVGLVGLEVRRGRRGKGHGRVAP